MCGWGEDQSGSTTPLNRVLQKHIVRSAKGGNPADRNRRALEVLGNRRPDEAACDPAGTRFILGHKRDEALLQPIAA